MIYIQFFIGFLMYAAMAFASYSESFKASNWYFPVGIVSAIIANVLWFAVAKAEPNSSNLMIKGLIWDMIIMGVYLIVPLLFFSAKFTTTQSIGVVLCLIGLLLTKI